MKSNKNREHLLKIVGMKTPKKAEAARVNGKKGGRPTVFFRIENEVYQSPNGKFWDAETTNEYVLKKGKKIAQKIHRSWFDMNGNKIERLQAANFTRLKTKL
jgi:hypothetical protein